MGRGVFAVLPVSDRTALDDLLSKISLRPPPEGATGTGAPAAP
jgi:hypothetical protein